MQTPPLPHSTAVAQLGPVKHELASQRQPVPAAQAPRPLHVFASAHRGPTKQLASSQTHAPPDASEHWPWPLQSSFTVQAPPASLSQQGAQTHEPSSSLHAPPGPQSRSESQTPSRLSTPHVVAHSHWPPGPPAAVGSPVMRQSFLLGLGSAPFR